MTKAELKARQAFGEQLTEAQQNIVDNDLYPNDYELTPWEAMNSQEQADKFIANAEKWGDQKAKEAAQRNPSRGYSIY
jgi:hypothetical protein